MGRGKPAGLPGGQYEGDYQEVSLLVKFARGSMFGEPGNVKRQRRIILDALEALQTMTEPGAIQPLPYKWKQPDPE